MKLAVEASAQVEGGHAVDVKIVAAPRTRCSAHEKNGNDEGDQPDAENHRRNPVGMGQGQRQPYRRHVDKEYAPKEPAALPYLPQS